MVKNMRPGDAWIPGAVIKPLGPVSYLVDVGREESGNDISIISKFGTFHSQSLTLLPMV